MCSEIVDMIQSKKVDMPSRFTYPERRRSAEGMTMKEERHLAGPLVSQTKRESATRVCPLSWKAAMHWQR